MKVGGAERSCITGAWRTTSKVVGGRGRGLVTRPGVGLMCRFEALDLGAEAWGVGIISWIWSKTGSRTGTAEREAEWMAARSRGRVYLRQVFPLGTDKTQGGEVLCSRWVLWGPQNDTIHNPQAALPPKAPPLHTHTGHPLHHLLWPILFLLCGCYSERALHL